MGEEMKALAEFRRATELMPSYIDAHRELGERAIKSREWTKALAEFGAILAFNGNDPQARREVARAEAFRGEH